MKEPYKKGVAPHLDPESCVRNREVAGEALTAAHADQVLSCEIRKTGMPTLLSETEGNIDDGDTRESSANPAQSKTLSMCGNSLRENQEIPQTPGRQDDPGRSMKANGCTIDMHVCGKSDGCILPTKRLNKDGEPSTEVVEGRQPAKGNTQESAAPRTQSRIRASIRLLGVRKVARRDKRARFTALLHHVTLELLRASYEVLKHNAAPGVDGVTWREYGTDLETRLRDLHGRIHQDRYRAQPSKRTYIPKADGRQRPLGIAACEDKIVQQALVTVLNQIYEEDFLGFSYGFRPKRSAHDALDALWMGLTSKKVNWVLDADIRGFFDHLDHEWMIQFLKHRIADPRVLRLIRKWLRAGVSENGTWSKTTVGTPQGAVISPLLANVYLHYVFDLWSQYWRKRHARGDMIIVRYADDFIVGFQHSGDAKRFQTELQKRLHKFGLELHPEKTRLIEFGRFAARDCKQRGLTKPETFTFLGFTHICTKTKTGRFLVRRKTNAKRLRAKLQDVKTTLRCRMHDPIPSVGGWLHRVLQGYYNYYAVLSWFSVKWRNQPFELDSRGCSR